MAKYEIKVSAPADLSGLEKTVGALTQVEKSAEKSAAAFKELLTAKDKAFAKEDATAQAKGLAELSKEAKNLGKVAEEAEGKKSKLTGALKKLGHEVPILGAAMSALANPFTIVTLAAAYAINKFQEFAEKVDSAAEAMRSFDTASLKIKNFDVLIAAGRANRKKFAEELADIAHKLETPDERRSRVDAQNEQTTGEKGRHEEARKGLALKQVELNLANGKISPEQAAKQRAQIELNSLARQQGIEKEGRDKKIGGIAEQALFTREEVGQLRLQEPKAEAAAIEAAKRAQQAKALADVHSGALSFEGKRLLEERANLEKSNLLPSGITNNKAKNAARIKEIDIRLEGLNKAASSSAGVAESAGAESTAANERLETIRSGITGGEGSLRSLALERKRVEQSNLQATGAAQAIGGLQSGTIQAQSGQEIIGIQKQQNQAFLEATRQLGAAGGAINNETLELMKALIARDASRAEEIKTLRSQLGRQVQQ